ncbi:hypothetical protein Q9323_15020 [Pseudomonas fulva]|uniref:hypothetical protein n=1 Tax=Pseudomonas fulva TaxID=47880 RepID=UPI0031F65984
MIETIKHRTLGVTFEITQMTALHALDLQGPALKRRVAMIDAASKGDELSAMMAVLGDDDDDNASDDATLSDDPLLKNVTVNGQAPDFDTLFAGRYVELASLYNEVIDANYGFLFSGKKMFFGPTDPQGNPVEDNEPVPAAMQRAHKQFSQPQIVYSVLMSDKGLATRYELQTIYNLEDLYALYELTAYEREAADIYRKKALAEQERQRK